MTKISLGEEKVYLIFHLMMGSQGKNLEAGADAEAMEGRCLLACPPRLAQLFFLYHPGLPLG